MLEMRVATARELVIVSAFYIPNSDGTDIYHDLIVKGAKQLQPGFYPKCLPVKYISIKYGGG